MRNNTFSLMLNVATLLLASYVHAQSEPTTIGNGYTTDNYTYVHAPSEPTTIDNGYATDDYAYAYGSTDTTTEKKFAQFTQQELIDKIRELAVRI